MCLRSLAMAPVSFVGLLDNSMSDESFSDRAEQKWCGDAGGRGSISLEWGV